MQAQPVIQYVPTNTALAATFANSVTAAALDQELTFNPVVTLTTTGGSPVIPAGCHTFTVIQTVATPALSLFTDFSSITGQPNDEFSIPAGSVVSATSTAVPLTFVPSMATAWSFDDSSPPTSTNDLPAGNPVVSITFDAGASAILLDGNAVDLCGKITNNSNNVQTIELPLTLIDGSQTIDTASGDVKIADSIGQSGGSFGITKMGSGTLVLCGANTYGGCTAVLAGVLQVNNSCALPAGGSLAVGAGAALLFGQSLVASPAEIVQSTPSMIASSPNAVAACLTTPSDMSAATSGGQIATTAAPRSTTVQNSLPSLSVAKPEIRFSKSQAGSKLPSSPVPLAVVDGSRGDLAWLGMASDSLDGPDSSDQHHKKDAAIQALEAVFTEYGR